MLQGSFNIEYYNQCKSQLPRTGNNLSHEICKNIVRDIFKKRKYETLDFSEATLEVFWLFGDEDHKIKLEKGDYYHQYDLWFRKKNPRSDEKTEIIVEVDGKKHDSIPQQIRDKKAESFIEFFFPNTYLIRVKKKEIVTLSGKKILEDVAIEQYINKLLNKKYGLNKDLL